MRKTAKYKCKNIACGKWVENVPYGAPAENGGLCGACQNKFFRGEQIQVKNEIEFHCISCDTLVKTSWGSELWRHRLCEKCIESPANKKLFLLSTEKKQIKCKICGKPTSVAKHLDLAEKEICGICAAKLPKEFICKSCTRKFQLREHKGTFSTELTQFCPMCLKTKESFEKALIERGALCNLCGRKIEDVKEALKDPNFKKFGCCKLCWEKYRGILLKAEDEQEKSFDCSVCGKVHVKAPGNTVFTKYNCCANCLEEKIKEKMESKQALKGHMAKAEAFEKELDEFTNDYAEKVKSLKTRKDFKKEKDFKKFLNTEVKKVSASFLERTKTLCDEFFEILEEPPQGLEEYYDALKSRMKKYKANPKVKKGLHVSVGTISIVRYVLGAMRHLIKVLITKLHEKDK